MPIIAMPSKVLFEAVDSVKLARGGVSMRSRYTGKRQVAMYPFAIWTLQGSLLKMDGADAGQWRAFLAQLEGQSNTFRLPVPGTDGGPLSGFTGTAAVATGETTGSNEVSIATTGTTSTVSLSWTAVPGATRYMVRRGTGAGAENVYYSPGNVTSFTDTGAAATAGSAPANSSTVLANTVLNAPTTSTTGGSLPANTYYYKVTVQLDGAPVGATGFAVASTGGPGPNVLNVGDYFTINDELKLCTSACGTGPSSFLAFEPLLRSAAVNGASLNISAPTCLMAAADNDVADWGLEHPVQHKVKLKLVEAF